MKLSVPPRFRKVFWLAACLPGELWWEFRQRPVEAVGDPIDFRIDRKTVASAKVRAIELKGRNWKVTWDQFEDLREEASDEGFKPNLYGGNEAR